MDKMYVGVDVGGSLTKDYVNFGGRDFYGESDNAILDYRGKGKTSDLVNEDQPFHEKLDLSINIDSKPSGEYELECKRIVTTINEGRWLLGTLAKDASVTTSQIPIGQKMTAHHYYLNIISTIVQRMHELNVTEVDMTLGVLLPARQFFDLKKEMVSDILTGVVEVENNLTGDKFKINITEVDVKPEAVVAFNDIFVSGKGLTELGEKYFDTFNVAIDIGENTTDIAGIDGGKPLPITFDSFDFAGKYLISTLEKIIEREYNYRPSVSEINRIFESGHLRMGAKNVWVGDCVEEANSEFARRLYIEFTQRYLLDKNLQLQNISCFLFLGGGSEEIPKVTSIREYFMEMVNDVSKFTESITPEDIRYANIKGLAAIMDMHVMNDKHKGKVGN